MRIKKLKNLAILIVVVSLAGGCSGKNATSYYKAGLEKFDNGNYEEASVDFNKALELNNNRSEYYIDYGMSLMMLGKTEEALDIFKKVIRDNDNTVVLKNNKLSYRGQGIAYYLSYDYKNAITMFEKALEIKELESSNADIYRYMASAYTQMGNYDVAITTYDDLISKNKKEGSLYNDRAYVYSKLGKYEEALKDYNQAIAYDKQEYEYYLGKYFLLSENGQEEEGLATLKLAENLDIKSNSDKYNLARIHYYKGQYDVAKLEFKEAVENGFNKSYYYLGKIYEQSEDYENALLNYNLYVENEASEKDASVYNQLGVIYIHMKDYKKAVEVLTLGMEYHNQSLDKTIRMNYITALEGNGEYESAYKEIKEYISLYPEDEDAARESIFIQSRLDN